MRKDEIVSRSQEKSSDGVRGETLSSFPKSVRVTEDR